MFMNLFSASAEAMLIIALDCFIAFSSQQQMHWEHDFNGSGIFHGTAAWPFIHPGPLAGWLDSWAAADWKGFRPLLVAHFLM